MSVLEPALMVIKPRGCGRLDELIDRSVEEAAAGGPIDAGEVAEMSCTLE